MKAQFGKFGVKHDYRGAHVTFTSLGRDYLGTIREIYRDEWGFTRCKVQHFCGEWWPFEPPLSIVEILERTYEKEQS